jgi:hypothetical protein
MHSTDTPRVTLVSWQACLIDNYEEGSSGKELTFSESQSASCNTIFNPYNYPLHPIITPLLDGRQLRLRVEVAFFQDLSRKKADLLPFLTADSISSS